MPTERWALVPVEATPEMRKEGKEAMSKYGSRVSTFMDADVCYAAMLNKNPGAALLAEVLAARDAYLSAVRDGGTSSESCKNRSDTHFALFAALDKIAPWPHEEADKLGPAAEGAT